MSKNKTNTIYNARKTDYGIPTFSMKSAFIMMLAASVGTLVVPYLLSFIIIVLIEWNCRHSSHL